MRARASILRPNCAPDLEMPPHRSSALDEAHCRTIDRVGTSTGRANLSAFNASGAAMRIAGLTSTDQPTAIKAVFATNDVRTFIANHLGVSVGRVTDEAHFTDDLGADWLDRLDLMIAVEDQFAGLEML